MIHLNPCDEIPILYSEDGNRVNYIKQEGELMKLGLFYEVQLPRPGRTILN